MGPTPIIPDPAATVIVLRPSADPFEVLMVMRHDRGFFGSLVVFPGGGVDEIDRSALARDVVSGESDDHDHRAAAFRELAEETGLVVGADGVSTAPPSKGAELFAVLREQRLSMPGEDLVLVSRWVTPEMAPRRFDTRFYLLAVDETPPVILDRDELVGHSWVSPGEALIRYEKGEWPMILPTLTHLRWLARRGSVAEALDSAHGADGRTLVEPRRIQDGSLITTLMPADE